MQNGLVGVFGVCHFPQSFSYIQYNLNGSNTDGSFTLVFSPYKILPIAQENKYLTIFFLFYHRIVCCVLIRIASSMDFNEYTQHTIIV